MRRMIMFVALASALASVGFADDLSLKSVRKMYIEKMPNDLDQYISAEMTKQLKGRVVVVLDKQDADGILRGTGDEKTGVGAAVTGRYLGLHDNATGSVSLVDKAEKVVLWSSEAGDRSMWKGFMARGGLRKVAERLVHDFKDAVEKTR